MKWNIVLITGFSLFFFSKISILVSTHKQNQELSFWSSFLKMKNGFDSSFNFQIQFWFGSSHMIRHA